MAQQTDADDTHDTNSDDEGRSVEGGRPVPVEETVAVRRLDLAEALDHVGHVLAATGSLPSETRDAYETLRCALEANDEAPIPAASKELAELVDYVAKDVATKPVGDDVIAAHGRLSAALDDADGVDRGEGIETDGGRDYPEPDAPELLEAIADEGGRWYVLRAVEAAGALNEMDAVAVADHELDAKTAPVEAIAAEFVSAWDDWTRDVKGVWGTLEWAARADEYHGATVDRYTAADA